MVFSSSEEDKDVLQSDHNIKQEVLLLLEEALKHMGCNCVLKTDLQLARSETTCKGSRARAVTGKIWGLAHYTYNKRSFTKTQNKAKQKTTILV